MNESLEKYKIVGCGWIDEYLSRLGTEEFCKFEARVYSALEKLGIISSMILQMYNLRIKSYL